MAVIPSEYMDAVVALGVSIKNDEVNFTATGFLYCHSILSPQDGKRLYFTFLVTNRHVITEKNRLWMRFNHPMGSGSQTYPMPVGGTDGSTPWIVHPDAEVDVAIIPISSEWLENQGIKHSFFHAGRHTFIRENDKYEPSEGDGVFILGFPLGLAGGDRNYAIVRYGILARIQDWLRGSAREFLIDASVFPGNSGGPVVTKPEGMSYPGTRSSFGSRLIGMVSSYLPYKEVAVSQQTGKPRMIFEENSGLGVVVPIDVIQETVDLAIKKYISTKENIPQLKNQVDNEEHADEGV